MGQTALVKPLRLQSHNPPPFFLSFTTQAEGIFCLCFLLLTRTPPPRRCRFGVPNLKAGANKPSAWKSFDRKSLFFTFGTFALSK